MEARGDGPCECDGGEGSHQVVRLEAGVTFTGGGGTCLLGGVG